MTRTLSYVALAFALLAGCSHGSARITLFNAGDAVFASFSNGTTVLKISPASDICSHYQGGSGQQTDPSPQFAVSLNSAGGAAVAAPGAFPVFDASTGAPAPSSAFSSVEYLPQGGCNLLVPPVHYAVSGNVTVTAVSGGDLEGSLDVMLNTGEHVVSMFSAVSCSGMVTAPKCE